MPDLIIEKVCVICGSTHVIKVPQSGYERWTSGKKHIQDAMPSVSADNREMLMSGICPVCFNKLFGYGD